MNRKGQEGVSTGPAAATVILTGLVIILYILFLPPAEREAILGGADPSTPVPPSIIDPQDILLEVHPRTLESVEQRVFTYQMNGFTLHGSGEDSIVQQYSNVYVFSSKTDKRTFIREFRIGPDQTYSNPILTLTFSPTERINGRVRVILNGEELYYGTPQKGATIILQNFMLEQENTLRIQMTEPGFFQFFSNNEATIDSVQLLAQVRDNTLRSAEQYFTLSTEQYNTLDVAYLSYIPGCATRTSRLLVRVNGQLISQAPVDCNMLARYDLIREDLQIGRNIVSFTAAEGILTIDALQARVVLREAVAPVYYFELTTAQKNALNAGTKKAYMKAVFVRTGQQNVIDAFVNGRAYRIDTRETDWERDITVAIEVGENYVRLAPQTTVDVRDFYIYLKSSR